MTTFTDLQLSAPLLDALAAEGYTTPTPIQAQAIPHVLAGKDLLGIAQTGTGKTAAFALPMLQRLAANIPNRKPMTCRALILSPTRELATQIAESFRTYGKNLNLSVTVVFGGVGHQPQMKALRAGVDILVATPGRLLDHLREGNVKFDHTEIFVLDEADQMLDMGFITDIRKIVPRLPRKRQSLFFSATMPTEIGKLAGELLTDPTRVQVTPVATTVELIRQRVEFMNPAEKNAALVEALRSPEMTRSLVFSRTKHGADKVVRYLEQNGIPSAAIHGNKSQSNRERALAEFKKGAIKVLVATDIAARGIDIDAVSHVVNYHLPNIPESYVHRIGRTARAGASGVAISFCDNEERAYLRDIERLIRIKIDAVDRRGQIVANSANLVAPESVTLKPHEMRRQQPGRGGNGQRHGNGQRPQGNGDRPAQGKGPGGGRPAHAKSGKPGGNGHGKPQGARHDDRRGGQPHRAGQAPAGNRPQMPTEPYRPAGAARANGDLNAMPMMRPVRLPE
ncbi:ATP-dependent RNA helicase RhlE [Alphaproteobacteria bacterium SO-S41]|nr:ATP-dependent RNA helicase RhlE [Alphaproteobacteria bacterium SO-S41]